ncbi:MAG TPA: carboxypeptidase regulatory-like domain-containing protein [Gammaproteobacteria bacterium]
MRRIGTLASCLLLAISAHAQTEVTVSGRLIDALTLQPVPFAAVTVRAEPDGRTVTGVLSDENGRFIVSSLPEGQYVFNAEFLGYQRIDTTVLIGELNNIYDLGDIELQPLEGDLEEVVITGRQQILGATVDRRVYSMESNISGSLGSVLDAMRGLPGVTVDQEGRVLLRGSDRVSILIDGKYSSLTGFGNQSGLDSIPAGNIESIEIINNPSAAYDAAGMAGIINIVYRKDLEEGLNIDSGLTLGAGTLTKRKDDLPTDLGSFFDAIYETYYETQVVSVGMTYQF